MQSGDVRGCTDISRPAEGDGLGLSIQESLADAKVSGRQHCSTCMKAPSEEIYSESMICDFLLMVNSNRHELVVCFLVSCGRRTYRLRDIFACRG